MAMKQISTFRDMDGKPDERRLLRCLAELEGLDFKYDADKGRANITGNPEAVARVKHRYNAMLVFGYMQLAYALANVDEIARKTRSAFMRTYVDELCHRLKGFDGTFYGDLPTSFRASIIAQRAAQKVDLDD